MRARKGTALGGGAWVYRETVAWSRVVVVAVPGGPGPTGEEPAASGTRASRRGAVGEGQGRRRGAGVVGAAVVLVVIGLRATKGGARPVALGGGRAGAAPGVTRSEGQGPRLWTRGGRAA